MHESSFEKYLQIVVRSLDLYSDELKPVLNIMLERMNDMAIE